MKISQSERMIKSIVRRVFKICGAQIKEVAVIAGV